MGKPKRNERINVPVGHDYLLDKPARHLTLEEVALIRRLIDTLPDASSIVAELPRLLANEMNDGGMGSLCFTNRGEEKRNAGHPIAELWFSDADGVVVLASLFADQFGKLYELDMWKTDNSPLLRISTPDLMNYKPL